MIKSKHIQATSLLLLLLSSVTALADNFTFSAPPRESAERAEQLYAPIADFLSKTTGHRFSYQHPGNWIRYQSKMAKGEYDLLFDGPHFVNWRIEHQDFKPLLKAPGKLEYIVVVPKRSSLQKLKDLPGKKVCAHAPPHLGSVDLLAQFPNAIVTPEIVESTNLNGQIESLKARRCVAMLFPEYAYHRLLSDEQRADYRIIHRSKAFPNQAISAGPRLSENLQRKIQSSLNSSEGLAASKALRGLFAFGKPFDSANTEEYQGLSHLLEGFWWLQNAERRGAYFLK